MLLFGFMPSSLSGHYDLQLRPLCDFAVSRSQVGLIVAVRLHLLSCNQTQPFAGTSLWACQPPARQLISIHVAASSFCEGTVESTARG